MYVARYPSHKVQEATRSAVRELGYQDVKPEQMKVVEAYVQGRGMFAVLPTGYGKSLCYGCLPIVFNKPFLSYATSSLKATTEENHS